MPGIHSTSSPSAKEIRGNNVVYEDLNFGTSGSGGPAATVPDYVIINDVIHREFTSANNQYIGDSREYPHHAKLRQTSETLKAYPHAHFFLKSGESEGTTGVTFTLYWELRTNTAITSGSDTISATSAELLANANQIYKQGATGFSIPTVSDNVGSQLTLRIARTAGNAGDIVVTTYGIHYPVDMLGSDSTSAKFA